MADFVRQSGGTKVIEKILIANNGIAAVKGIRSIRKWAYETFGDERAIEFTVMATPEDMKANADYIRMADNFVEVPGGTNNNNYANVELIVDLAERLGVHGVWAGWGHASENPKLPDMLSRTASKIAFLGPPGSAMRALGDKISSTIVAQSANVPCIPWSGDGLTIDCSNVRRGEAVSVPADVYERACVSDAETGLEIATRIGFPVMVKASEGGGGKGIRLISGPDNFAQLFAQVQGEVPGSPIFIMRVASNARHLEVQVLADQYGNAISIFGRDCSVQRRHQKIIEEAPVTIAPPETLEQLEKGAVRLAGLVGYASVGTVEYLYMPETNEFCFLELNPRLQVEHPTTEMVSSVNLPAAQLQVSMGIPLHRIRDIRVLYGLSPSSTTDIDLHFDNKESYKTQSKPAPRGHVIAVRLTAENPDQGFKPSSGVVHELNFRSSTNVWGYFSVGSSGGVHEYADSQFGHVFAYGENRQQARRNMVVALKEVSIRSDFRTTVEYLITLLQTEAFEKNQFTTAWLDALIRDKLTAERPDRFIAVVCGAVYRTEVMYRQRVDEYKRLLQKGQNPSADLLRTDYAVDILHDNVKYSFLVTQSAAQSYTLFINGSFVDVNARSLSDGGLLIQLNGRSHVTYAKEDVASTRLVVDGKTCVLEKDSDPTKLRAPSPGKLVRYVVEDGDHVDANQPYAEIEVMKMYMPLVVSEAGTVRFLVQAGSAMQNGDVIGILTLDDPSRVKHAQPFEGLLPKWGSPAVPNPRANHVLRRHLSLLEHVMAGFDLSGKVADVARELFSVLRNPELPYLELQEQLAALESRLPPKIVARLQQVLADPSRDFPAQALLAFYHEHAAQIPKASDRDVLKATFAPIAELLTNFRDGSLAYEKAVVRGLLTRYLSVELLFSVEGRRPEDVLSQLRDQSREDLDSVVAIMRSHAKLNSKNALVLILLDHIKETSAGLDAHYASALNQLADLQGRNVAKVALKARALLVESLLPSYKERQREMETVLTSSVGIDVGGDYLAPAASTYDEGESSDSDSLFMGSRSSAPASQKQGNAATASTSAMPVGCRPPELSKIKGIVERNVTIYDVLHPFFFDANLSIAMAAVEVYIRRAYRAYVVESLVYRTIKQEGGDAAGSPMPVRPLLEWNFRYPMYTTSETLSSTADIPSAFSGESRPRLGGAGSFSSRNMSVSEALFALPRNESTSSFNADSVTREPLRTGMMTAFASIDEFRRSFGALIDEMPYPMDDHVEAMNVLNVALTVPSEMEGDDDRIRALILPTFNQFKVALRGKWIRRVTFVVQRFEQQPAYFTFRERDDYGEDTGIRHLEPALAFQLELFRMVHFDVRAIMLESRSIHMYYGTGKQNKSDERFFVRALIRPGLMQSTEAPKDYLISEADRVISESLDALELKLPQHPLCDCNQLFMNFIPTVLVTLDEIREAIAGFIERHGKRMSRLRVTLGELKLLIRQSPSAPPMPVRFVIGNVTGFVLNVHAYKEVKNEKWQDIYVSLDERGPLHGLRIDSPYSTKEWLQPKRYSAHLAGTTYIYDFPELFRQALHQLWVKHIAAHPSATMPSTLLKLKELVLDEKDRLHEVWRPAGANTISMVAWIIELFTPECPSGRRVIVIGNDITHVIGSFGPAEDRLFYKASELARKLGIPRIYISANSGARIGIADEMLSAFRVAWVNSENPSKGTNGNWVGNGLQKWLKLGENVFCFVNMLFFPRAYPLVPQASVTCMSLPTTTSSSTRAARRPSRRSRSLTMARSATRSPTLSAPPTASALKTFKALA